MTAAKNHHPRCICEDPHEPGLTTCPCIADIYGGGECEHAAKRRLEKLLTEKSSAARTPAEDERTLTRFMLRDEAIDALLTMVEESSSGWLTVKADNGLFRASYATGVTPVEGDESPSLTNALTSLLEKLS